MITDLSKHKDIKKAQKVVSDLEKILVNLQSSLDLLKEHKQYVSIMECLSVLSTSYKITEIQIRKAKEFVAENKK